MPPTLTLTTPAPAIRCHEVKSFPNFRQCAGLSQDTIDEHYQIYCRSVAKYNDVLERLYALQTRENPSAMADLCSLKVDLVGLLGAVRNHELYFDIIAEKPQHPPAAFVEVIAHSFANFDCYLSDLRHTALASRGWTWTVWDPSPRRLFNFVGPAHHGFPVWDAVPIVALDLFEHACFYDYGAHKSRYVDAILQHIDWPKVARRYEAVVGRPALYPA